MDHEQRTGIMASRSKRKPKYCCVFCDKPITGADLWVVEAYPRGRSNDMAGESKKMCTNCCREFFHLLRERVAQKMEANEAQQHDETERP